MDTMLLLLITGISIGFFIQTITGFAGALVSLPFLLFVMPLSDAIAYLSIFYSISTPIYVYKEWQNIDTSKPVIVHCKGGYRSAIATSILHQNLKGAKIYDLSFAIEEFKS